MAWVSAAIHRGSAPFTRAAVLLPLIPIIAPMNATPSLAPAFRYRPWLHVLAMLTVAGTLLLILIGGKVTSMDAGMAVPEGFYTFGYWSLTAPLEVWWHDVGARWEHSHRLKGYVVGTLAIALAIGTLATQRRRPWVRASGTIFLILIIGQGVLGILRVNEISTTLALLHGVAGQLILCVAVLIAAATSRWWIERLNQARAAGPAPRGPKPVLVAALVLWIVLLIQLILGATLRHSGGPISHLAIPDYPLAFGRILPPLAQDAINTGMDQYLPGLREQFGHFHPYQVLLAFAHRWWAVAVVIAAIVMFAKGKTLTAVGLKAPLIWLLLILILQIALGVGTIWFGLILDVTPWIATLHQTGGAALLMVATWLAARAAMIRQAGAGVSAPRPTPPSADQAAAPIPADQRLSSPT
jgi:cytochrome c oxidase assembly protein subunit 15